MVNDGVRLARRCHDCAVIKLEARVVSHRGGPQPCNIASNGQQDVLVVVAAAIEQVLASKVPLGSHLVGDAVHPLPQFGVAGAAVGA